MAFVGNDVWCAEVIDSICQFMQKQLTQKAAEWTLLLPANAFTQLEQLRSVTGIFVQLLWIFLCIYGCPPSNCLFGIRQIHFIAIIIIIIIIIIISDIININIVNKRLCSLVIVI